MPCRSGSPQGVRGAEYEDLVAAGDWAWSSKPCIKKAAVTARAAVVFITLNIRQRRQLCRQPRASISWLEYADRFERDAPVAPKRGDRKSTRLNSSHSQISYAVFCLK